MPLPAALEGDRTNPTLHKVKSALDRIRCPTRCTLIPMRHLTAKPILMLTVIVCAQAA